MKQWEIWTQWYLDSLEWFDDFPMIDKSKREIMKLLSHWKDCRCVQCKKYWLWFYQLTSNNE